jgi:hypothetical protein
MVISAGLEELLVVATLLELHANIVIANTPAVKIELFEFIGFKN